MNLNQYQKLVDKWIKSIGNGYFSELSMLAQLTEELGEVSRVINRTFGQQKAKVEDLNKDLSDELAGMLFAIACLANSTGIDLQKALKQHLKKITKRDQKRFI